LDCIKEFHLLRVEDETGVSGVGIVARGVILPSGKVVLEWVTFHSSVTIYENFSHVEEIHGHHGKTKVVLGSPPAANQKKSRKKKDAPSAH